jgi:hypothetical protein
MFFINEGNNLEKQDNDDFQDNYLLKLEMLNMLPNNRKNRKYSLLEQARSSQYKAAGFISNNEMAFDQPNESYMGNSNVNEKMYASGIGKLLDGKRMSLEEKILAGHFKANSDTFI